MVLLDGKLEFLGIRKIMALDRLAPSAFELLPLGETISREWNISSAYNFGEGGKFTMSLAADQILFAEANSTEIVGQVQIKSSAAIDVEIDSLSAVAALRRTS